MTEKLRVKHVRLLSNHLGPMTPYKTTGSKSMFQLGEGGPLLLVVSATQDREYRVACHIRACDAKALSSNPGSAVSCLWPGLDQPLVIPMPVLEGALSRLTPTSCNQYALKVYHRDGVTTLVPTETPVDQFANAAYLATMSRSAPPTLVVPRLTHPQWQSFVAAIEYACGFDIAVPFNNRKALDRALCNAVKLVRMDVLPDSVRNTRAKDVDVVATPRGGSIPAHLIEVEHGGDIRSALHRCEHVLAHLRRTALPDQLPRVTIVADASRRAAFERYVNEAPLPANGFTSRCAFRSFEEVYRDALQLLPTIPSHLRAA